MRNKTTPQDNDIKTVKKFFSSSLKNIFFPGIKPQSIYAPGDIIHVIRNAISVKEYIETYVRNNYYDHIPSADTVFRKIIGIASESGSHKRSGSRNYKRHTIHAGMHSMITIISGHILS